MLPIRRFGPRVNGPRRLTTRNRKSVTLEGGAWQYPFMGSGGKLAGTVALSMFLALALSGCIGVGSGFAVLDRDAEPEDVLPSGLPDFSDEDVEPSSSRFVGEHDGDQLYLAKSKDGGICLLVAPENPRDWVMGCGAGIAVDVGGPSGNYLVRPDAAPAPEDSVRISPNVYAAE